MLPESVQGVLSCFASASFIQISAPVQPRAVELSALGPKALSFTSQTSSQQSAEERGTDSIPASPPPLPACTYFRHPNDLSQGFYPSPGHMFRRADADWYNAGVVEAEVFENERFLPFRGWGHEWPGHLLPTDRVGHWSLRGDRPSGAESMDFHRVAPPLPKVHAAALPCSHHPSSNDQPLLQDSVHWLLLCCTPVVSGHHVYCKLS